VSDPVHKLEYATDEESAGDDASFGEDGRWLLLVSEISLAVSVLVGMFVFSGREWPLVFLFDLPVIVIQGVVGGVLGVSFTRQYGERLGKRQRAWIVAGAVLPAVVSGVGIVLAWVIPVTGGRC
jgi:hypothetical protein